MLLFANIPLFRGYDKIKTGSMSVKDVKIDKKAIRVFSSFAEADAEDKKYWHEKTSDERLEALELMRQSAYGYENPTAGRLQRVLEVVKGK